MIKNINVIFVKKLLYVSMPFQVELNIKEIKMVNGTLLEAIDYVKTIAINLNN